MSKRQDEYKLQVLICRYINLKYPKILFMSDTIASVKLTIPQAVRNKQIQKPNFKCPDIIIFEPNKTRAGLFLELKAQSPFTKSGKLKQNEHLQAQNKTMLELESKGYECHFIWDYDQAIHILEQYFANQN